jgi:hypothetical protein
MERKRGAHQTDASSAASDDADIVLTEKRRAAWRSFVDAILRV